MKMHCCTHLYQEYFSFIYLISDTSQIQNQNRASKAPVLISRAAHSLMMSTGCFPVGKDKNYQSYTCSRDALGWTVPPALRPMKQARRGMELIHRNSLWKSNKLMQRKTECSNTARKGAASLGSPFCLSKLKTLPRIGELLAARETRCVQSACWVRNGISATADGMNFTDFITQTKHVPYWLEEGRIQVQTWCLRGSGICKWK